MTQPTYDELHAAWTKAIHAEDIPGSRAEALQELREARDAKTTWFGKQENDLRFALDAYLRDKSA